MIARSAPVRLLCRALIGINLASDLYKQCSSYNNDCTCTFSNPPSPTLPLHTYTTDPALQTDPLPLALPHKHHITHPTRGDTHQGDQCGPLEVLGRGEHEDHAVFEKGIDVDHGGLETGQAVSMWVGLEGLLQLLDLHHINSSVNLERGRRHLGEIEDDVSRSG